MKQLKRIVDIALLILTLVFLTGQAAFAHPMGNFAICHDSKFTADGGILRLRYVLDFAEIPTVTDMNALDANHDRTVSDTEKTDYLAINIPEWKANLTLTVDEKPTVLEPVGSDLFLRPGAGGLQTMRVVMDWRVALPTDGAAHQIHYTDANYKERTGWKEISAIGGAGVLSESSVETLDRSAELTAYPANTVPPQETEARFTVGKVDANVVGAAASTPAAGGSAPNIHTPQDAFTRTISTAKLTPAIILIALGVAFIFGAFHALSPGHGKTMVAAYLVGSHGTPKHAVLLGLTVTITHTFGVFALGFITLFASQYIVPERLYSVLSIVSGLSVFGVGVWLLATRSASHSHNHNHEHSHSHDHDHLHDHSHSHGSAHDHSHEHDSPAMSQGHFHTHEDGTSHFHTHEGTHAEGTGEISAYSHAQDEMEASAHDHTHTHTADTAHTHDHAGDHGHFHTHSHGGHSHSHAMPEGPITLKSLIALGISGGIVPCPSALVVLLSAIALHRLAFGMLLIVAFSAGLASVLIAIGIAVVSTRKWIDRIPQSGRIMRAAPLFSAGAITLIGAMLVIRALTQGAP